MTTKAEALALVAKIDPRRHHQDLCLPCMKGEHSSCRKTGDGPRFARNYEKPCLCMLSGHAYGLETCRAWIVGDWGDGHPCGRKATGTIEARAHFGSGIKERPLVVLPACGTHLGHKRRRQEREAARLEERSQEREADEEAARRCRVVNDVIELFARLDLGDGRAVVASHTHGKYHRCDGRVALDSEVARAIAMRLLEQEEWA